MSDLVVRSVSPSAVFRLRSAEQADGSCWGPGFCLFVSPGPCQQVLEVGAGELPLQGPGDPAMQTAFAG
jgi:hypothetical protein